MRYLLILVFSIPFMAYSQNQVIVIKESGDTILFSTTELRGHKDLQVDGKRILYDINKKIKLISWQKSGKLNGYYAKYYDNNQIEEEGMMIEGNRVGLWYKYYSNGKIKEKGCYYEGKQNGKWEYYNEQGELIKSK